MGLEVPAVVGTVVTGIVLAWLIFIYLAKPIAQSGEAVENDDVDEELLDTVSVDIKNPTKFWNNIKSRSFVALCKKKELPVEIVRRIIMHI